jgi:hypothetical protein
MKKIKRISITAEPWFHMDYGYTELRAKVDLSNGQILQLSRPIQDDHFTPMFDLIWADLGHELKQHINRE